MLMRFALAAASPLKWLDVRSRAMERRLGLALSENEIESLRASGNIRLGAYYHWYLQKRLVSRLVKAPDRTAMVALIDTLDSTDYAPVEAALGGDSGVLIAMPHHAHYILSMIALAGRIGRIRPVNVFYGHPATHRGNQVFDHLHGILFAGAESGVTILHDNRHGLAGAIRALRNGEIVMIMPDAFRDERATMMFPFCGRLMHAMSGTAVLARRTGSWILPAIPATCGHGPGFRTRFGDRIDPARGGDAPTDQARLDLADYGVMRRLFAQFEDHMTSEIHLWQHARSHFARGGRVALATRDELPGLVRMLERSSGFNPVDVVVDLT